MTPDDARRLDRLVIIGPPGAGKSTWARANAPFGVPILDFDALAYALGSPVVDHHVTDHPTNYVDAAYVAWRSILNYYLAEPGPLWVIHAEPSAPSLFQYADGGFGLFDVTNERRNQP